MAISSIARALMPDFGWRRFWTIAWPSIDFDVRCHSVPSRRSAADCKNNWCRERIRKHRNVESMFGNSLDAPLKFRAHFRIPQAMHDAASTEGRPHCSMFFLQFLYCTQPPSWYIIRNISVPYEYMPTGMVLPGSLLVSYQYAFW